MELRIVDLEFVESESEGDRSVTGGNNINIGQVSAAYDGSVSSAHNSGFSFSPHSGVATYNAAAGYGVATGVAYSINDVAYVSTGTWAIAY